MKRYWTKDEEMFLLDNRELGANYIANHLGKSAPVVRSKAQRCGIKLGSRTLWKKEEELFLINNCDLGSNYIAKHLGKTPASVYSKAYSLNLRLGKTWTEADEQVIKDLYLTTCPVELSKKLNCTQGALNIKAWALGIKKSNLDKENTTGYLYIVTFPELNLHKVGISRDPSHRFKAFGARCEILSLIEGKYSDIEKLEKYLLNYIKPHLYNSGQLKSGNTETYKL